MIAVLFRHKIQRMSSHTILSSYRNMLARTVEFTAHLVLRDVEIVESGFAMPNLELLLTSFITWCVLDIKKLSFIVTHY